MTQMICLDCGKQQTVICGECGNPACIKCDYVVCDENDQSGGYCCDRCSLDSSCEGIPPTAKEVAERIVSLIKEGELEELTIEDIEIVRNKLRERGIEIDKENED